MEQLLIIALAHFLALLSPGPDFFLVARSSINSGWRIASGACLGIALANGAFIAIAFTGLSVLQEGSLLFTSLQLAGASYLLYIGVLFLRHAVAATEGQGLGPALAALWGAVFTTISFLTTTGFVSADWQTARLWSGLETPGLVLAGLAILGGGVATLREGFTRGLSLGQTIAGVIPAHISQRLSHACFLILENQFLA